MDNKFNISLLAASVFMAVSVSAVAAEPATTLKPADILEKAQLEALGQVIANGKEATTKNKAQILAEKPAVPTTLNEAQQADFDRYKNIAAETAQMTALKNNATIAESLAKKFSDVSGGALYTGATAFDSGTIFDSLSITAKTLTENSDIKVIGDPFDIAKLGTGGALKAYKDSLSKYADKVAGIYTAAKKATTDVQTIIGKDAETNTDTEKAAAKALADKILADSSINVVTNGVKKWTDKAALSAWISSATVATDTGGVQALGKVLAYHTGMERWQTVVENVNTFRGDTIDRFIAVAAGASHGKTSGKLAELDTAVKAYNTALVTAKAKSWKEQIHDPASFQNVADKLYAVLEKAKAAKDEAGAGSPLKTLLDSTSFNATVGNPVANLQKAAQGIKKHTDGLAKLLTGVTDNHLTAWKKAMEDAGISAEDKEKATKALLDDYMTTLIAIGRLSGTKANVQALDTAVGTEGYQNERKALDTARLLLNKAQSVFRRQYVDYLEKQTELAEVTKAHSEVSKFADANKGKEGIKEQTDLDTALAAVREEVKKLSNGLFGIADPDNAPTGDNTGLQTMLGTAYQKQIAKFPAGKPPTDAEKQALIIGAAKALAYLYDDKGAATPPPADDKKDNSKQAPLLAAVNAAGKYYLSSRTGSQKTSDQLLKAITEPQATAEDAVSGVQAAYDQALTDYNDARDAYLKLLTAGALKWQADISDLSKEANIKALKDKLSADDLMELEKAETELLLAASKAEGTDPQTFAALVNSKNKSTLQTATELNSNASTQFPAYKALEAAKTAYTNSFNNALNVGSMAGQAADIYGKLQQWNSNDAEQKQAYDAYVSLLAEHFSQTLASVADQKDATKNPDHLSKTLYLGGLTSDELATLDANGDLRKLSVIKGKNVADSLIFTEKELYTGSKDKRMTTTALNIEAPKVTADTTAKLADQKLRTLTVGGTDVKNRLDVYTKTYSATGRSADRQPLLSDRQKYLSAGAAISNGSGAAVRLAGDLRDGNSAATGVNRMAADKLLLQNMDIDNTVSKADLLKDNATGAAVIGLLISSNTVTTVPDFTGDPGKNPGYGRLVNQTLSAAPKEANIVLQKVNITLHNGNLNAVGTDGKSANSAAAVVLEGSANHISISGDGTNIISATGAAPGKVPALRAKALRFDAGSLNNIVDISGMQITGDIEDKHGSTAPVAGDKLNSNSVNLTKSVFTGNVNSLSTAAIPGSKNYLSLSLTDSNWTGASANSPDVTINSGSVWNLTDSSSVNFLTLTGGNTINMVQHSGTNTGGDKSQSGVYRAHNLKIEQDLQTASATAPGLQTVIKIGGYSKDDVHLSSNHGFAGGYNYGSITVNHLITGGGKLALTLANAGAEPTKDRSGTMLAKPGDLAGVTPHAFVTYLTKETRDGKVVSSATDTFSSSPVAELGVWQYQQKTVADDKTGKTSVYFVSNGRLSSSAATVASLAAAPASVAAIATNALDKHISSLRHSDSSGVWVSYYGGGNKNTLKSGPAYGLKTSGLMLGVDTSFSGQGQWLAGVAFSSGKSTVNVHSSSGDLNSYGAQFWLSRSYDNGVFVNGGAQFGHYSNSASVRMQDGKKARGDYATNGYGLNVKLGYHWQNAGFYAEPYVQADARAFSGASYKLNNGMLVNSTDYKSFSGEIGTDLGYTVPTSRGYIKPYLHLAVLNEFASDNHITANNIRLPNSINGAALRLGVGGEVKLMQNLGGYASFDYTKGSNTERPWQVNMGINYTW